MFRLSATLLVMIAVGCDTQREPSATGRTARPSAPLPTPAVVPAVPATAERPPEAVPSTAAAPRPVPPAGAVGYWKFDNLDSGNVVVDTSGHSHHGIALGGGVVAGRLGRGLELDGNRGGATIRGLATKGRQRSISLWIYPHGGGLRRLVHFDGFNQVGFDGEALFVHTGRVGRADTNTPHHSLAVPARRWTQLTVTWDTAAQTEHVKVYVDGALRIQASLARAAGRSLTTDTLRIGHDDSTPGQTFWGIVDEVALYDRVLSIDQVQAYYKRMVQFVDGETPTIVRREIVSHVVKPKPPYVPRTQYTGPKKLIRVGSELASRLLDAPSIAAADLPAKVKIWQQTGLDGLVFSVASHRHDPTAEANMSGQWWNLIRRDYGEFQPEITAFRSVADWGRLTDHFLWSSMAIWGSGVASRCQDWFSDDDWDILLSNVRLQARIARESGFRGILLDTEQYPNHHGRGVWYFFLNYRIYSEDGYRDGGEQRPRPFPEVAAQVRRRGAQYARALCEVFPGIRLMVLPGLYETVGQGALDAVDRGLFPAFLDGLLSGLDDTAQIIGGHETTYDKTSYRDIGEARRLFDASLDRLCSLPEAMQRKLGFAAGIWADAGGQWSTSDASLNARTPAEHAQAIRNAFRASGEYAWLYGEKSRFLAIEPGPLMQRYLEANVEAHNPASQE